MRWLLDLLYPPRCMFCHTFMPSSAEPVCPQCSLLLLRQETVVRQIGKTECLAPLHYVDLVRNSLHRYKFGGCAAYARTYAELIAACLARENKQGFDLITWVPVSRKRKRKRGYDQGRLLAAEVGKLLNVPAVPCLKKVRNNPPQSGITDRETRKSNVKGVFALRPGCQLAGKRVLLLDDIITTGATMEECCRILKKNGVSSLCCGAVASV